MSSKSLNCGGEVRLHDERGLLARPDGDARALLDDALLEDAAGCHETDAQDLGTGRLLHRPHHGRHLAGAAGAGGLRTEALVHLRHSGGAFL